MTIQEKLNLVLGKASLSEDSIFFWQEAPKYLKNQELMLLIRTLEDSTPEEIQEFSRNLNRKVTAIKNNNLTLWNEIINEEKVSLS